MIYEEAGVPHMAGGGALEEVAVKLAPGAEQLFKKLSKKLSTVLGRSPTTEELSQLQQEVHGLSAPSSTMEGANLARVAKQEPYANMLVDQEGRVYKPGVDQFGRMTNPTPGQREYLPYETAFDTRDEFQTHGLTGRTNAGTRLAESAEIPQEASLTGSEQSTPTIQEMADHLSALGVPHDYTGVGPAVYGDRPSFGAGTLTKDQKAELEAWRDQARNAGIPESAITSKPSQLGRQFQYLKEQQDLGPAGPEASMGGYADGGTVEEGLNEVGFLPRLKGAAGKFLGHGLNIGLGAMSIPEIKRALQASEYGKAAGQTLDAGAAFLSTLPFGIYEGGKQASEMATNNLANRPQFSQQMTDTTSTDLGGALGGDYSLANAILNARNKQ
jgi:hypothetical protein